MPLQKDKTTYEALQLLQEGTLALAEIERAGVRVDKGYLESALKEIDRQVREIESRMSSDKVFSVWKKAYRDRMNTDSRVQLADVVFEKMGMESAGKTATGRDRTDVAALESLDLPFVHDFLEVQGIKKARSTYLEGIRKEMIERDGMWFVHPFYNLNTVRTMRSSSSSPNFQNIPVRNPKMGEMIRRCYIPRPGRHFTEIDFCQIEVRISACYNKDPMLLKYINDPSTDMHRDMAMQIYMLRQKDVTKEARHAAKNQFVFPQFYGSVWFQCAPHLWDAIDRRNLTVGKGGISVKEHLANKGIRELDIITKTDERTGRVELVRDPRPGTFGHHLKKIEEDFWGRRFRVYSQWKRDWYDKYLQNQGFRTHTGFFIGGQMKRNEVINYPVQSDAFMCELWSLVKMTRLLRKYRMKTLIVGEIHDSDQSDVPPDELNDFLNLNEEVKTKLIRKEFPWIITPIDVEMEVSPLDRSWYEKEQWVFQGSCWQPKPKG